MFLRQSTAQTIRFGPCLDITDGVTEETALTLAQADMRLSKDGGAFAQKSAAGNATHDSDGWYSTSLSTTDTGTVGELVLNVHQPANMLPVWEHYWVLEEAIYDAIFGAAAAGFDASQRVDVGSWIGTAVTLGAGAPDVNVASEDNIDFGATKKVSIADTVWDEPLSGSSHNIATSAGRRLRQVEESIVFASGTIAVVTDGHTLTLDAGAVATTDYYLSARLQIIEGVGAGQSRIIIGYTAGRVVTLDSNFTTNPDTSSLYEIDSGDVHVSASDSDLAKGFVAVFTNTTTITLDSGAIADADYYVGELIIFTHGTGAGQAREITAYTVGRVVTMSPPLDVPVDTTTTFHIQAVVSIPEMVDEMWDEAKADHVAAGSMGEEVQSHALESVATEARLAELDAANIPADVDAALTRIPAALVGGRIDASVGAMATNVITAAAINAAALTAAKFAAGAIDANAFAADAVDKIRDGLLPTQNATFNNINFLLVAASDNVTPVTGATGLAVTRSIDSGAFASGTGTLAEIANGIYQYDASAADMNGGVITFRFTATGGTPGAPNDRFVTIITGGGV